MLYVAKFFKKNKKIIPIIFILIMVLLCSCRNNNRSYIQNHETIIFDENYSFNFNGLIFEENNIVYYSDYFDDFKIKAIDKKNDLSYELFDVDGKNIHGNNLIVLSDILYYINYSNSSTPLSLYEFNLNKKENEEIIKTLSETTRNVIIDIEKKYYYFGDYFFGGYGYIDLNFPDDLNKTYKTMVGVYNNETIFVNYEHIFFGDEPKYNIDDLCIDVDNCIISDNYLYMPTYTLDYKVYKYDLKNGILDIIYQIMLDSTDMKIVNVFDDTIYLLKYNCEEEKILKYNLINQNCEEIYFSYDKGIIFISNIDNKIYCVKDEKLFIIN